MNRYGIEGINIEKINIDVTDSENGLKLIFDGDIDMQNPDPVFVPFYDKVHDVILDNEQKFVELDFTKLKFLNSRAIKSLIKWITKVILLPKNEKYKFIMILNSKILWQETSLRSFSRLAPGLIEYKVI